MAVALNEPEKDRCIEVLSSDDLLIISSGTLLEVQIVAAGRNMMAEMSSVLGRFDFHVVEVTEASANRAADAYRRWGEGSTPRG